MMTPMETAITGAPRSNTRCRLWGGGHAVFRPGDYVSLIERPGTRPTELRVVLRDDGEDIKTPVTVTAAAPLRKGWIRRMGIGTERRQHGTTVVADVEIDDRIFREVAEHRRLFGRCVGGNPECTVVAIAVRFLLHVLDRAIEVDVLEFPEDRCTADEIAKLRELRSNIGLAR
jgi:hypothetical protein